VGGAGGWLSWLPFYNFQWSHLSHNPYLILQILHIFMLSLNTNTMFNPYSEFPFLWIRLSKGTQFRITFMEVLQHLGYHENIAHSPWCSVICLCNSVYLLIGHHSSIFNPLIWSVFTLCSLISSTVWILFLIYNILWLLTKVCQP